MKYSCPGFSQLHIDVARFATDDFNPFHDPRKWRRLRDNPFRGPIVLGFQTAAWTAERVTESWRHLDDPGTLRELPFYHYQFNFTAALKPGQAFELTVKPARFDRDRGTLTNRVLIKSVGGLVAMGQCGRSRRWLLKTDLDGLGDLTGYRDRSDIPDGWFLKRKFMMTANGKNFLLGCQLDPWVYFDELESRIRFPPMFPVSYVSCALLERAWKRNHDFEAEPMVYARHEVCVDLRVSERIRSDDCLHLLVRPERQPAESQRFVCLGLIGNTLLFAARITLVPLAQIVAALRR